MKTNKTLNKILSGLWIVSLAMMVSCGPGKESTKDGKEAKKQTTKEETVEALDTKIRDINQDLAAVEREIRANGRTIEGDMEVKWEQIEAKRQELNKHIERYNSAAQRDAELEAAEIRAEIDNQLQLLEREIKDYQKELLKDSDKTKEGPY